MESFQLNDVAKTLMTPERAQIVQRLIDKEDGEVKEWREVLLKNIHRLASQRLEYHLNPNLPVPNLYGLSNALEMDVSDLLLMRHFAHSKAYVTAIASMNPRLLDGRYYREIFPHPETNKNVYIPRSTMSICLQNPFCIEPLLQIGVNPNEDVSWSRTMRMWGTFIQVTGKVQAIMLALKFPQTNLPWSHDYKLPFVIEAGIWTYIRERLGVLLLALTSYRNRFIGSELSISLDCVRRVSEFIFRATPGLLFPRN